MGLFSKKDKDDARRLSSHAAPTPPSTSLPARPATATASSGPDTTPLYARFARAPTGSSLAFPSGRDSQQLTDSLAKVITPDSPHPSSSLSTNLRAERERARVPSGSRFASSALGREFEERRRTDSSSSKRTPQRTQTLPEPYPEPSPTTPQKRPSLSVITPPSKVVLPSPPSPEDIAPPPVPVKSTTTIVPTASPKLASATHLLWHRRPRPSNCLVVCPRQVTISRSQVPAAVFLPMHRLWPPGLHQTAVTASRGPHPYSKAQSNGHHQ
ncbi:hypothetical protein BKA62DRAFT_716347 [Auriculariales sp. MPI-PUGE-AT-0066]|nr:hypothetical protein BKA62DRAFT_716347 [Auriculariales sp. MPI-PUGE-AT-0066]